MLERVTEFHHLNLHTLYFIYVTDFKWIRFRLVSLALNHNNLEEGFYNLKLGSSCNLGKGLSKNKEDDQMVKCKDTELYIYLITMKK